MAEVGKFLGVPVSTVKNNLYSAGKRLKRRYMAMMKDNLRQHAPGNDFNERVRNGRALWSQGEQEWRSR
jgi:hypothetical protein